jgi:hypoxanthine phosphoribosyltransferase
MSFFENFSIFSKKPSERENERTALNKKEEEAKQKVLQTKIPVQRIVEKLTPVLESGEIQLIIGDDASGRIPTAIFRKIFDLAYKERGFTTPETRFITGGGRGWENLEGKERNEKKKKIEEFLSDVKSDVEKKFGKPMKNVLVVTDTVDTGKSLDILMETLKEAGMTAAVASLGVLSDELPIEKRWGAPLLFGSEMTPGIYSQSSLSGVSKDPEDLFAKPLKSDYWRNPSAQQDIQKAIKKSRETANDVASEVYKEWRSSHVKTRKNSTTVH